MAWSTSGFDCHCSYFVGMMPDSRIQASPAVMKSLGRIGWFAKAAKSVQFMMRIKSICMGFKASKGSARTRLLSLIMTGVTRLWRMMSSFAQDLQ